MELGIETAGRVATGRTLARTLIGAIVTLFAVSVITFAATNLRSPEEVARNAIGRDRTPEQLQVFITEHHLDGSAFERYVRWLKGFVVGDWGASLLTDQPIRPDVFTRLARSMIIAIGAVMLALPFSLALGLWQARRRGNIFDVSTNTISVVVAAMPEFVIAIVCLWLFSIQLRLLPVDSSALAFGDFGAKVRAFGLPVLSLAIALGPQFTRITRAAAIDVVSTPYVRAAILRGLSPTRILSHHVLPNTAAPVVNTVAVNLVWLIGGVVVVENVFGFPGLGQRLVTATAEGDVPVVQAVVMVTGVIFIAIALAADALVRHFTPRMQSAG